MAAEVSMSRVVEYLKKKKKDDDKPQPVPVLMLHHNPSKESTPPPTTRDLLGLEFQSSQELVDLDSHVPSGWEKRLDLKVPPSPFLYQSVIVIQLKFAFFFSSSVSSCFFPCSPCFLGNQFLGCVSWHLFFFYCEFS